MAKSIVRNILGGETKVFALPCDGQTAKAFCDKNLEGEYVIIEQASVEGNKKETSVIECTVTLKSSETQLKKTISFYMKSNKNENDIKSAFFGKTISGVKVDEIYIIHMKLINIGKKE